MSDKPKAIELAEYWDSLEVSDLVAARISLCQRDETVAELRRLAAVEADAKLLLELTAWYPLKRSNRYYELFFERDAFSVEDRAYETEMIPLHLPCSRILPLPDAVRDRLVKLLEGNGDG